MKYLPISADIRSSNQITIFTLLFQNTFQNSLEKPEIMQEEDKEMAIAVSEPTDSMRICSVQACMSGDTCVNVCTGEKKKWEFS